MVEKSFSACRGEPADHFIASGRGLYAGSTFKRAIPAEKFPLNAQPYVCGAVDGRLRPLYQDFRNVGRSLARSRFDSTEVETSPAVLADQIKSLDWTVHKARRKGTIGPHLLGEVCAKARALIGQ